MPDYGMGLTNIDKETGIRYGVISQNEVLQAWCDYSEAYYGEPHCPKCGDEADEPRKDFDYGVECGVFVCGTCHQPWYPMELDEEGKCPECSEEVKRTEFEGARHACGEHVCHSCGYLFDGDEAFGEQPISHFIDDGEYKAECGEDGDIFVMKSPYYTYGPFCSPCAPGAVSVGLASEYDEESGERAYCFDASFFQDNKAPYRYWSVATGEEVK